MIDLPKSIGKSLTGKVVLAIGLLVLVTAGASWYWLISQNRKNLMSQALEYTASYSDLIKKSVYYDMLTFNRDGIQHTIESISSSGGIRRIRIFDSKGKVFYSSHKALIGTFVDRKSFACAGCHSDPEKPSTSLITDRRWVTYAGKGGRSLLTYVEPIFNEPSCDTSACHVHSGQKVLGILETDFSVSDIDRHTRSQTLQMTHYAVSMILLLALTIYLVIRKFVLKPLSALSHGMKKVATGSLQEGVDIRSADEIGVLANTFNLMTRDLSVAREEIRKSGAELKALYDISLVIAKTHDAKRLLSGVLDALTGMDLMSIERRGALLLVEEGRLNLNASLGLPDQLCAISLNTGVDHCLCRSVAKTGELLISRGFSCHKGHTSGHEEMCPQGHIIVPLKSEAEVAGVLCLYVGPGVAIENSFLNTLRSAGSELGIAIDKARLYKKTKELSLLDSMTGIGNRRLLEVMLHKSFAQALRFGRPLSLMMIDIDHFKKFNDTFGHVEGDRILAGVAQIIAGRTREGDLVVRYGGEEFLILLHQTALEEALEAAEGLRTAVEVGMPVTISLGVAALSERLRSEVDLIKEADEALYRAKRNGRNRIEPPLQSR